MDGSGRPAHCRMDQFQADLLEAAMARREAATLRGATKEQFIARMENEGGFVYAGFCGSGTCEAEIKEQTKATIRVLPDEDFARRLRRPRACGATARVWPRPCGRRRTERAARRERGHALPARRRLIASPRPGWRGDGRCCCGRCRWRSIADAGGHAGVRVQRRGHSRPLPRRSTRPSAAFPTESVSRSKPTATWPCCASCETSAPAPTSSHRGAGPRPGRRLQPRAHRLQRSREDGRGAPAAIRAGVGHLNVESRGGAGDDREPSPKANGAPVRLGIRVNPDVTTETHPYISTGKSGIKFGLPTDQVVPAAEYILRHPRLELTTIAMHLGSQLVDTEPFRRASAGCWS